MAALSYALWPIFSLRPSPLRVGAASSCGWSKVGADVAQAIRPLYDTPIKLAPPGRTDLGGFQPELAAGAARGGHRDGGR
jgi:hypothetical protein